MSKNKIFNWRLILKDLHILFLVVYVVLRTIIEFVIVRYFCKEPESEVTWH